MAKKKQISHKRIPNNYYSSFIYDDQKNRKDPKKASDLQCVQNLYGCVCGGGTPFITATLISTKQLVANV